MFTLTFADGRSLRATRMAGGPEYLAGHRRDVLTVHCNCSHADALAAFGQAWSHTVDGQEGVYDHPNYTLVGSILDNLDGTCVVKVGRINTREEDLEDQLAAAQANAEEQAAVVDILTGGAV